MIYEIRYKSALFGTWALYDRYLSKAAAQRDLIALKLRCLDASTPEAAQVFKTACIEIQG